MKVSFREDDGGVLFVISDYPSEYAGAIEHASYSLEDGCYVKRHSRDAENIAQVQASFARCADEMFAQLASLREAPWEDALLAFIDRLQGTDIDWWLTGSCAASARGVPIQPHDLDIILHSEDIPAMNALFGDCLIEPIESSAGWVVRNFGVLFMHARIDLAFDPEDWVDNPEPADFGPYAMRHLEQIQWRGHTIKVPPLELQLQVNRRRGRSDRAAAIEDHLRRGRQ